MQYIKLTNGIPEVYSIGQLLRDNPNVSFPKTLTDILLEDWGIYPLKISDKPEYDPVKEICIKGEITEVNGVWTQGWKIENIPQERIEASIRSQRNNLLQQTDWMALSDNTLTQPWVEYRQALRDITNQAGFPYSVVWPTKPV